jgi:hypothetical protein
MFSETDMGDEIFGKSPAMMVDSELVMDKLFQNDPEAREKAKEVLYQLRKIRKKEGVLYRNFIKKFDNKGLSARVIYKLEGIRAVRFYKKSFGAKMIQFFPSGMGGWYKQTLITARNDLLEKIRSVVSEQTFSCPICKKVFPMDIAEEVSFRCCSLLQPINGEQISEVLKRVADLNKEIDALI